MARFADSSDSDYQTLSRHILLMSSNANVKISKNWDLWIGTQGAARPSAEPQFLSPGILQDESPSNINDTDEYKINFGLPHRRNHTFTGRKSLLDQVHGYLTANDAASQLRTVVLHGTGGMGKTQVALEYAYLQSHSYTAILWINAQSIHTVHSSFANIAQKLVDHYCKAIADSDPNYGKVVQTLGMVGLVDSTGRLKTNISDSSMMGLDGTSEQERAMTYRVIDAVNQWLARKGNER